MNRDGMIDRANGLGNQVISGERLSPLRSSCADLHARVNGQCCDKCEYSETDEQEFPLQRHQRAQ
jgi:hypothetical protein